MKPAFWTYFTAALFFNFGFSLFFFLFNIYLLSLGYNEQTLGLIGSFALAGRFAGVLPAGWCAARFGIKPTLLLAVALSLAATIGRIAIPARPAQLLFSTLAGITLCAWGVCLAPAVAALTTEARRPFAFSLIFASGIGDAGIGAYAAGHLPTYATQRNVLYLGAAIASISLLFLARLRIPATNDRVIPSEAERSRGTSEFPDASTAHDLHPATAGPTLNAPARNFLPPFLLATAVWSIVLGAFPPFANVFFTRHLHLTLQQMGSVLSIAQFVQFAVVLASPLLIRRTGLRTGILLTQLLTAISLVALGASHTLLTAATTYLLYTTAQNSNEPAIASLLMDRVSPHRRSAASSYSTLSTAGAQILASYAVGWSIVHLGYSPVLYTLAALALLAATLFYRLPNPLPIPNL